MKTTSMKSLSALSPYRQHHSPTTHHHRAGTPHLPTTIRHKSDYFDLTSFSMFENHDLSCPKTNHIPPTYGNFYDLMHLEKAAYTMAVF